MPGTRSGLNWDGSGSVRRMLYWLSPMPMYPATFLFKVFQRNQVRGVGDGSRYYTTFFWGNNGRFDWGAGYGRSYYGAHPYPIPAPTGDGKWEISTNASDYVVRDDGSSPYVVNDRWYSQAFVAQHVGGGTYRHRFYIDLPNVDAARRITDQVNTPPVTPPAPIICVGQAPGNGLGQSWGGYSRWEEQNAIIRGLQFYAAALSEAHIAALAALETDAEVRAYCASNGITSLWYLNMNPTPEDVSDKKGTGTPNNPFWLGSRAGRWSG
ncbi:MAG: hypothetical protein N2688_03580 [Burkholderiaceae bacterium]|nr:hypothetical protein [Burkholderiaceae bacterium]